IEEMAAPSVPALPLRKTTSSPADAGCTTRTTTTTAQYDARRAGCDIDGSHHAPAIRRDARTRATRAGGTEALPPAHGSATMQTPHACGAPPMLWLSATVGFFTCRFSAFPCSCLYFS